MKQDIRVHTFLFAYLWIIVIVSNLISTFVLQSNHYIYTMWKLERIWYIWASKTKSSWPVRSARFGEQNFGNENTSVFQIRWCFRLCKYPPNWAQDEICRIFEIENWWVLQIRSLFVNKILSHPNVVIGPAMTTLFSMLIDCVPPGTVNAVQ